MAIPPFFLFHRSWSRFPGRISRSATRPQAIGFAQQNRSHQKSEGHTEVCPSLFCDYPQVLLSAYPPPHIARKGMCARETFAGFPLHVQSKAANGGPEFCSAKLSSTKREPPKGWLSFVTTRRCCCLCISACSVSATAVKRFLPSGAVIYMQFAFFCCTAD